MADNPLKNLAKGLWTDFGKSPQQRQHELDIERMKLAADLDKQMIKEQFKIRREEMAKDREEKAGRIGAAMVGQDRIPAYSYTGLGGETITTPGLKVDSTNALASGMSLLNEAEAADPVAMANNYLRGLGTRPMSRQLGQEAGRTELAENTSRQKALGMADRLMGASENITKIQQDTALKQAEMERDAAEAKSLYSGYLADMAANSELNSASTQLLKSVIDNTNAQAFYAVKAELAALGPQAQKAKVDAMISEAKADKVLNDMLTAKAPWRDDGMTIAEAAASGKDMQAITLLTLARAGKPMEPVVGAMSYLNQLGGGILNTPSVNPYTKLGPDEAEFGAQPLIR